MVNNIWCTEKIEPTFETRFEKISSKYCLEMGGESSNIGKNDITLEECKEACLYDITCKYAGYWADISADTGLYESRCRFSSKCNHQKESNWNVYEKKLDI